MSNVIVKENHLTYGGVAYFRAHAEEIELGSTGEKRKPLFKQNYLEVKDRVLIEGEGLIKATEVEIDFSKTSKTNLALEGAAIVEGIPVNLDTSVGIDKLFSGNLKLIKFSVDNNDIKDAINASPSHLESLAYWGARARVVQQIFTVVDAELAKIFTKNVGVGISAGIDGLKAELGVGVTTSGYTKVKFARGCSFAYIMAKIRWNDDRTRVMDLDDDQWATG